MPDEPEPILDILRILEEKIFVRLCTFLMKTF